MPKVTIEFEVDLEWDEDPVSEDRRYTAYCRRLPGCSVQAGTEAEAVQKMGDAVDGWLAAVGRLVRDDPDFARYAEGWFPQCYHQHLGGLSGT